MTMTIPFSITLAIVATSLLLPLTFAALTHFGASRAALPDPTRRRLTRNVLVGYGLWALAVILTSPSLAEVAQRDPYALTLQIPLFGLVGIIGSIIAYRRSADFRRALTAIPLPALVGVQYYRVIGGLFLVLYSLGTLPAHFALPAGWGDVTVGLVAPLLALALVQAPRASRPFTWLWNIAGITDLIVAIGMATGRLAPFLDPSLGNQVPAAAPMGAFPLILVPAFAVPVSLLLHVLVLRRLAGAPAPKAVMAAA